MDELLKTGLQLTIYGMGLVFLALALLWGLLSLLLRLDRQPDRPAAAPPAPAETPIHEPAPRQIAGLDPDLLAAITIAVMTHRAVRRKQAAPTMRRRQPDTTHSRWVGSGRAAQNVRWHPRRR